MRNLRLFFLFFVFLSIPARAADAPASEDSIKQLLAVTQARKLADNMMAQMDNMMHRAIQQAMQGQAITPDKQKILDRMQSQTLAILKQELDWSELEPLYIRVYRDTFTQADIDGMLAFYRTPSGQALIKKMPKVMQKTMVEMQQRMGPLIQKMKKIQMETVAELTAQAQKK